MEPSSRSRIVAEGAILLGVVAFCSPVFPTYPVPIWIFTIVLDRLASQTMAGYTVIRVIYAVIVAAVFWVLARPLRHSGNLYPQRSMILAAIGIALSAIYFIASWRYALTYQGAELLSIYVLANGTVITLLVGGWQVFRKSARWWPSFWLHWILLAWILCLAFPWLGEMI